MSRRLLCGLARILRILSAAAISDSALSVSAALVLIALAITLARSRFVPHRFKAGIRGSSPRSLYERVVSSALTKEQVTRAARRVPATTSASPGPLRRASIAAHPVVIAVLAGAEFKAPI